ncbi:hypothetical protein [Bacillus sp. FJAT-44742]|nr:hypothetical protein [Bacillus sp. FJAT-44742]
MLKALLYIKDLMSEFLHSIFAFEYEHLFEDELTTDMIKEAAKRK